jgi:hypothetical protein
LFLKTLLKYIRFSSLERQEISAYLNVKNVEGSCCGLIGDIVHGIAWKNLGRALLILRN